MSIKEVIVDAKKKKGKVAKILEERMTEAEQAYEGTRLKRLTEEEEARIRELRSKGQPVEKELATSFSGNIMRLAQVDPVKAKEFLDGLDEETMGKMAYLMALENDRTGAFLKIAQSPSTDAKTLVELAKQMHGNGSTDLKGIAELLKVGIEMGKASNPQPQSLEQAANFVLGIIKPFQEGLSAAQQTALNAQIETLKAQMPPSPKEYLTMIKEGAKELGLGQSSGKSELDLRLEEMRQSHDLDMHALSWEQQKYMLQAEAERDKWAAIQQTFQPILNMASPEIRSALRKIGQDVGKNIEGVGKASGNPTPEASQVEVAPITCANCGLQMTFPPEKILELQEKNPNLTQIPLKCPKCGAITNLVKQTEEQPLPPAPPEEKPSNVRLKPIYR